MGAKSGDRLGFRTHEHRTDAVDDDCAHEFREHSQQAEERLASRRAGVETLLIAVKLRAPSMSVAEERYEDKSSWTLVGVQCAAAAARLIVVRADGVTQESPPCRSIAFDVERMRGGCEAFDREFGTARRRRRSRSTSLSRVRARPAAHDHDTLRRRLLARRSITSLNQGWGRRGGKNWWRKVDRLGDCGVDDAEGEAELLRRSAMRKKPVAS